MKKHLVFKIIAAGVFLIMVIQWMACKKDISSEGEKLSFVVPEGWPAPVYDFSNNEVTSAKFELGKALFYDVKLSVTNTISCGTCHQAFSAFAQLDHDVSHGIYDRTGKRNSPPLFNLNWHPTFFWDGRVNHIEVQPLAPLADSLEMGEEINSVLAKLRQDAQYPELFSKAYGDSEISSSRMLKAIAVFMGMMVSDQSKYDQYVRGEVEFTAQEKRGLSIFEDKCATCHTPPLFSDFSFRSNGMPIELSNLGIVDSGKGGIFPVVLEDLYKFKVPSLRNLKYTFPYMHNGRIGTLEGVLNHYASIDPNAPNLDPLLKNGIHLNADERKDLLAFLNTLNDEKFVKDKRFMLNP